MLYYFVDWLAAAVVPVLAVLIIFGICRKTSAARTALMILFAVYFAVMLDITGIIDLSFITWDPEVNFTPFSDLFNTGFSFAAVFQYIANMIMFIPFGFLLPIIWRSFRRMSAIVIAGFSASLLIEISQLFNMRSTAIDDIIMNTAGAVLGYLIIYTFLKASWKQQEAAADNIDPRDIMELSAVTGIVFVCALFVKYSINSFIYSLPMFGS